MECKGHEALSFHHLNQTEENKMNLINGKERERIVAKYTSSLKRIWHELSGILLANVFLRQLLSLSFLENKEK